ncbi:M23 family metallopeptidase [Nocardia sp. NPDC050710]|uniref:M23 family metallopeptidase n=1 Tax=Nocardia sp. NPDC050710 TaxID=3157220 RepID=UPI00340AF9B2
MPVTDLLFSRQPGATRSRRYRVATRVVAASAVVTAAFGVLAATNQPDSDTGHTNAAASVSADSLAAPAAPAPDAPIPAAPAPDVPAPDAASINSLTPPEPPPVAPPAPEPAVWEQNNIAAEPPRPLTVRPVGGVLTSNFGMRWGAMHAGLDFGDPLGAPIASVTDGVVIEAGPASGFGLWVRVQQDDGTVGVYGHVNDILAFVGQEVRAGDIIATVGNRGYSTGPHLHYEVHEPGIGAIDPRPWLAARGIDVGFAD